MPGLPVTSFAAGVAAIGLVGLSIPVSVRRFKVKAVSGDGGDEMLRRLVRAQGNFIEYVPMGLIVMALLEVGGSHPLVLWTMALLLILGRVLHAAGMIGNSVALRGGGMLATYTGLLAGAAILVVQVAFA